MCRCHPAHVGYVVLPSLFIVSTTWFVWGFLVLALVAANLPFLSSSFLGLLTLRNAKGLRWCLLELLLLYFLVGALALVLEKREGQIASQGWEFYAVTTSLFITFAFPGFVYRYLLKRKDF